MRACTLQDITSVVQGFQREMVMEKIGQKEALEMQQERLELQREQLKVAWEWSHFLRDMVSSQDYIASILWRIGKGQIVLRTQRVEEKMEVLVRLGRGWRRDWRNNWRECQGENQREIQGRIWRELCSE